MPYTIVYYIDSNNFGGAEQVLYTILKGIDIKLWHPIVIYHPSPGIMPFIKLVESLQVDTLSTSEIRGYKDITGIFKFAMKLRSIRPTIFHANLNWPLSCSSGIIAAYLAGIHTIIGTQHLFEEIRSRRDRVLQKIVSLMMTRYIAISSDLADQLKKTIFSEKKIIVVQNGINLEYYSKKSNRDPKIDVYGRSKD
ncbi:MAG: glycosyltransferase, partial [Thermodesulfobacteriota bacterium]